MPVIRDMPLNLLVSHVLQQAGITRDSNIKAEADTIIHELMVSANDEHLLEPAVVFQTYSVTGIGYRQLSLQRNIVLHGSALSSVFAQARELAVLVCTIGSNLENKVTEYFAQGQPLQGLLLDSIGNAAVESLVQESCEVIKHEALLHGNLVSSPLSPGGRDFPISEQWHLFKLVQAQEIGVNLTSSGMMMPRKSISAVIGIGPHMKTWTKAESCARCNFNQTCRFKIRL